MKIKVKAHIYKAEASLLRKVYIEHNGAEYIFLGMVDTDGTSLKAVRISVEEFAGILKPDHTREGHDSIRFRPSKQEVFELLYKHLGHVEAVGKLEDMLQYPGKNRGEKFEAYIIARFGWTPAPTGSPWYKTGDATDDEGRQVQIGFEGKTACDASQLKKVGY